MRGIPYFKHDHRVSANDNHADTDFLAARSLLQCLVEYNVQVDLRNISLICE
jgi:hypothetical protein